MPGQSERGGTGWSAADDQLLTAVREAVVGTHELLGTVGRDGRGMPALLARELATEELVVLLLGSDGPHDGASADFELIERRVLDGTVPAPEHGCPVCHAPHSAWVRRCLVCGSEMDGAQFAGGVAAVELLDSVRRSTAVEMEVLGMIQHAGGGGPVFFARERGTGAMVALTLTGRTVDAAGRPDIALGVTTLPALGAARSLEGGADPARPVSTATQAPGIATISLQREALAAAAQPVPDGEKVCPQCGVEYPAGVRFCARDGAALRARATSDDLVGQIVADKYSVLRRLGVGGMGEVYLAEHVHMGRECALKVMRRELTNDPDAAGRFRREAANASRINHPNIATIYDFGETAGGIAYIVMEYVDGEPLSAILEREKKLDPARAVAIARQVAEALGAAHEMGIVHRDLKPDNVMIMQSRGTEIVKVVDFGIAKAIQGGSRQLTRTGYVLGTPAYMSPEQIVGEELDGRSDQYNLACILYEMLTGQVTFAGTTGELVIHRRLTEPPPHPRKLNPAVSRALDAAVVNALARTPGERFPTAADFGHAIGEAIAARSTGWSPLAWLGRGHTSPSGGTRTTSATARGTPAPPSAGLGAPRVRPPTGSTSAGSMQIVPPPEPPNSPPVARPKWPDGSTAASSEAQLAPGATGGGTRTPASAGGYSTQPSGEPSNVAVTGERSGERMGERSLESSAAPAIPAGRGTAGITGGLTAAPAARPTLSLGRVVVTGGIVAAGAVGIIAFMTRRAPEPGDRAAVSGPPAVASTPPASSAPPASSSTDSSSAAAGGAGDADSAARAVSTGEEPTAGSVGTQSETQTGAEAGLREIEAQLARQETLARSARSRALAAGASARALSEGDSLLRASRAWKARGNYVNALRDGLEASRSWAVAERAAGSAARERAGRSSTTAAAPPTTSPITTEPARQPESGNDGAPTVSPAEAAAAEAAGVLRSYVAALSKRDIATMRQLWPTMPDNTVNGFQNLFKLATNFSASLGGEPAPRVNGADADAELRYSLDYFLPSQGAHQQSFRLHAVMRRDGSGWKIRSLEPVR